MPLGILFMHISGANHKIIKRKDFVRYPKGNETSKLKYALSGDLIEPPEYCPYPEPMPCRVQ